MRDRTGQVGASNIAALFGYNPWSSAMNEVAVILGRIEVEETARMTFGRDVQPVIAGMVEKRTGLTAIEDEVTIYHPKYPWMQATPDYSIGEAKDGALGDDAIPLELKFVGEYTADKWGSDGDPDGVPEYVSLQCIQQANLLKKNKVKVAALIGGYELRLYELDITDEAIETLETAVVDFYEKWILPGKIPEADYRDIETLKRLYPHSVPNPVAATDEAIAAMSEFNRCKAEIKSIDEEMGTFKVQVQELMGENDTLIGGDGKALATWKQARDSTKTDWERLARQIGEPLPGFAQLVEKYSTTTQGSRRFLPKLYK